ncbi:tRNA (5-methylaminomethyl-2-thiouridine)(34)-methyltransferase MnmD [Hoeflea prorocentri]|uniref:tRNA (5-methylaminomethyl-2-thiouridine)(34)-methyltransferase MnmD n=1 Tax=Hoeflea prorocentri TaxID=1922333 RepID=A0A9X3ZHP3_9HYPH|nr:tRNA (5-methylaminomethyl-2-thiouridine)(34)-methyltransferase MnmD [Hoeflea prorocentri]MCY6382047.1 tRNA (5-methylaminomethyl-2-thiouridine)(34)-methyltransferase MnmD [Hoeflea prorocentri]MDA5399847.1 tRNA (5-methylaminomethyl-2-thiouridine)(34)-methyltransferase MnmD [Hoeflea prorocentri]
MGDKDKEYDAGAVEWHEGDMPYSPEFGDHFYSRADGRKECGHVFIGGNGLPERWRNKSDFTVAELGFGTGLNFAETLRQWLADEQRSDRLTFVSFELHPLSAGEIDRALAVWPELDLQRKDLVQVWPPKPDGIVRIDLAEAVSLKVHIGKAFHCLPLWRETADAWYLDGFAPARNPEMWSQELMQAVFDHTGAGGTCATYSAAGWVRRNLQAAGFEVEKRPGYAGKRDMMAGRRGA